MGKLYQQRLVVAAVVVLALLAGNVALTLTNTRQLYDHAEWVAHTFEVISGLENLLSLAKDAETGQRGYLISGEDQYLEPYSAAVAAIHDQVDALERLTADNARQQEQFPELRRRLSAKLKELSDIVALRKAGNVDGARQRFLTDAGKVEMDVLRRIVGEMSDLEESLLREREQRLERTYATVVSTGLISGLLAMAAVVAFLILMWRHYAQRSAAAFIIAEQAERLRTTLASIGDAVITTDNDGRVTNMNAVAETLTGWTIGDASGQSLDNIFNIVNEETRKSVESPAKRALREGIIVGLANHTILIARDGAVRPIDDSAAPIRCKDGEIVGCVLVFRDISERKQAEERQREDERRFRMLIEQIRDYAIFMIDREGRATTWNAGVGRVLGFEEAEFTGCDITPMIFTPEDVEAGVPERELHQAAATGSTSNTRWMRHHNGTRFFAVGATSALHDEKGEVVGFMKVMRDQTDQKKLEDDLRQLAAELSEADRRKNEFLAMLAHELRNPLAPIRNAVQVIRLTGGNGEAVASASEMMERQVAQLVRLVDDLLDVSRISRGRIELRREEVELTSLVHHAVDAARAMSPCAEKALTVTVRREPIYLDADPTRISQVIGNLLNNACKFTDRGGRIELFVTQEDSKAVLRVRDNGIGIAADQIPHIFEMFMQVDTSLERTVSGLGIGLTLVKNLVEMHNGTVEVQSAGRGQGSEFTIRLPCRTERAQPGVAATTTGTDSTLKPRRFLVVDDNRDSATTLAMLLQMTGNETHIAYDGQEAVEMAEKLRPEVVVLDIGLPKLNGYEACRRIREEPWGKDMVLIALTGWGQDDDRRKSKEAGFNGHMVKPVDHSTLMRTLAEL